MLKSAKKSLSLNRKNKRKNSPPEARSSWAWCSASCFIRAGVYQAYSSLIALTIMYAIMPIMSAPKRHVSSRGMTAVAVNTSATIEKMRDTTIPIRDSRALKSLSLKNFGALDLRFFHQSALNGLSTGIQYDNLDPSRVKSSRGSSFLRKNIVLSPRIGYALARYYARDDSIVSYLSILSRRYYFGYNRDDAIAKSAYNNIALTAGSRPRAC